MPFQKGNKLGKLTKGIPRLNQRRENNSRWKGDNISYCNLHKWVTYNKGKPSLCEFCGNTKAKKYEWASRDHSYSRDLNSYIRLCTSCHRLHDIEANGYRTVNRKSNRPICEDCSKPINYGCKKCRKCYLKTYLKK